MTLTDTTVADIQAAGAVVWRADPAPSGTIEVLLVHRGRRQDWSWPKGKAEPGECLPACAVREVEEETGLDVVLGRPLASARYDLADGQSKHVSYWAATPAGGMMRAFGTEDGVNGEAPEIDEVTWADPATARRLLSYEHDRALLDDVLAAHHEGTLDTCAVLVLRHGRARARTGWVGPDSDRPLVPAGRREALALVPLLAAWRPMRVLTSPWERCKQTVAPYAAFTGARLRTKNRLSEDGFARLPSRAPQLVKTLMGKGDSSLVCSHRPLLPPMLAALGVPTRYPLRPAEVLVAHVTRDELQAPHVVATERHLAAAPVRSPAR